MIICFLINRIKKLKPQMDLSFQLVEKDIIIQSNLLKLDKHRMIQIKKLDQSIISAQNNKYAQIQNGVKQTQIKDLAEAYQPSAKKIELQEIEEQRTVDVTQSDLNSSCSKIKDTNQTKSKGLSRLFQCIRFVCSKLKFRSSNQKINEENPNKQYDQLAKKQLCHAKYPAKQEMMLPVPQLRCVLSAQRSMIKLGTRSQIAAMLSVHTGKSDRAQADIICIIDTSGSMNGVKLQLVKQTLQYMIKVLKETDRLSIVSFSDNAQTLCELLPVNKQNSSKLNKIVRQIMTKGGTNIYSGIQKGLQILIKQGDFSRASSLLLLSDGINDHTTASVLEKMDKLYNLHSFPTHKIYSFGFGDDHDEKLMKAICEKKNGKFYYIKELNTLDEAFCNAVGEILSVIAQNIRIRMKLVAEGILNPIKISKVYGDIWKQISQTQYEIYLQQISSQLTKDFVFELQIPRIDKSVGDLNREAIILQATFQATSIKQNNLEGKAKLVTTLLNKNEKIPQFVENSEVIENLLRVKTAEVIIKSRKKADSNQYKEANKDIDAMMECIRNNKQVRRQKVLRLLADLQIIKLNTKDKQKWTNVGRKKCAQIQNWSSSQMHLTNQVQRQMSEDVLALKRRRK